MNVQLYHGDCLQIMPSLPTNSVDSIVCDPPYMLNFMGKAFDRAKDNPAASVEVWRECLRVAKPGAHLLAFGGDRTHHRMMVAIEDAGWEIRTCLYWIFGSGFPKSLDIAKQIDKMAGAEREVIGSKVGLPGYSNSRDVDESGYGGGWKSPQQECAITAPATDAARQWAGWGTALKPAAEIIVMARKPLSEPTIAANVLAHGVGGLNIDGCRVGNDEITIKRHGGYNSFSLVESTAGKWQGNQVQQQGRWPANLCLSEDAAALLDEMSGTLTSGKPNGAKSNVSGPFLAHANGVDLTGYGDTGGASRFFYVAKASKRDRDEGLEGMEERHAPKGNYEGRDMENPKNHLGGLQGGKQRNFHPTVKPTQLMCYLCRLVTPPNGTILDPFMGSGSTGKAAILEGFNFIGIELENEYLAIAQARCAHAQRTKAQMQPMLLAAGD